MQSVSSRTWTHVVVSISNDDNHYIIYIYTEDNTEQLLNFGELVETGTFSVIW